ncbi:hypothetical protein RV15_GL001490 [Enterococcus silesiacus]|uniref:Uncharacterized protein n=1 Tax=Enterococcus silesiacus TaxID=332949 RepID=A0AA91JNC7_9ENTE|nr:hypothetical protein RV15_GL001490 [Enterococcus silesiacus]
MSLYSTVTGFPVIDTRDTPEPILFSAGMEGGNVLESTLSLL